MAGSPTYIDRSKPIDPNYSQYLNTVTNLAETSGKSTRASFNNYVTARQGVFSGAFGSSESNISIASDILDITKNSTGDITIRRTYHINPETGTSDTLIGIETDGIELPYQELFLIGVAGDTISITHDSGSVTGTQRAILCPNNTTYTVSGDDVVHLIYDTSLTKWIVLSAVGSSSGDNLGNHTATQNLDMGNYNIANLGSLYQGNGTGSQISLASTMALSASTNMNLSDSAGIFLNSNQTTPSVEFLRKVNPYVDNIDLGDATHRWGDIFLQSGTGTSKIYLDGGGDTYITGSATSGRINIYNDGSNITSFGTFGILTTDVDINGNELILDPDGDSIISSISDDNIQISTGGSVRASISNTGLLMATPITMLSSDIDLDGNELTIDVDGDSYIQAVSDDTIQVVTSGTLRLQVDNSLVFANQDVGVITGKSVKGFFGVIGLQVSSSTLTVGSAGSLQVPYLSSTTTYSTGVNSTLDGIFGNLDGCMGIQYNSTSPTYTVWYRLNGGWRRTFLT